jgi:hypothetical protein
MTYMKRPRIIKHWDAKEEEWIWAVSISVDGMPSLKSAEKLSESVESIVQESEGQSILTK